MKLEKLTDGLDLLALRQVTHDEKFSHLIEKINDDRNESQRDQRPDANRRAAALRRGGIRLRLSYRQNP